MKLVNIRKNILFYLRCRRFRMAHLKGRRDIRLILGSGSSTFEGWVSTDVDTLDVTREANWWFLFKKDSITAILAEHVWEHLGDTEAEKAFKNCYEYLKKGGRLRIAVPDGYHPNKSYIEFVRPGGTGPGSDTHKKLYNYITLGELLSKAGFKVEPLEYWDEGGRFYHKPWKKEDGFIQRSMENDKRNAVEPLSYTSLIIDGIK